MMIAIAKEPRMSGAAKAWCEALELSAAELLKLEQTALLRRVLRLEISEDDLANLEHLIEDDSVEPEAALRSLLSDGVVGLAAGRRDITSVLLHNTWWSVSGGMSWGDAPTDAYDLLIAIDAMGVTDRPLSPAEVKAAHAAMVAA